MPRTRKANTSALGASWLNERVTSGLVPPDARLRPTDFNGVSRSFAADPEHRRAYNDVATGEVDWAEVRASTGEVLYRAWRVSRTSFAWQTSIMPAPAFEPYRDYPAER